MLLLSQNKCISTISNMFQNKCINGPVRFAEKTNRNTVLADLFREKNIISWKKTDYKITERACQTLDTIG